MLMSRCVPSSLALVVNTKPLIGALAAALLMCSAAHAAELGHSRVVSALGQPLRIDVPIVELSADDLRTLAVSAAPAAAWAQAGLTPPVDLASLRVTLADGYTPGTKVVQLSSSQSFNKAVADVLLDVRTAAGQQRHQVSLLTQGGAGTAAASRSSGLRGANGVAGAGGSLRHIAIQVKPGDTMFAIARRHAVQGVTVYQMMIALQRANPQAFIHENINLVRAGATLHMPDMAALTAVSDREARRLFMQQVHAFAQFRQRAAGAAPTVQQAGAAAGTITEQATAAPQPSAPAAGDQLRLSGATDPAAAEGQGRDGARTDTAAAGTGAPPQAGDQADDVRADDSVAARKNLQESRERVSTLEENVKHLNEALQAQGAAASDLVVEGAMGLTQSLAGDADTDPGKQGEAVVGDASGDTATAAGQHQASSAGGNAGEDEATGTSGANVQSAKAAGESAPAGAAASAASTANAASGGSNSNDPANAGSPGTVPGGTSTGNGSTATNTSVDEGTGTGSGLSGGGGAARPTGNGAAAPGDAGSGGGATAAGGVADTGSTTDADSDSTANPGNTSRSDSTTESSSSAGAGNPASSGSTAGLDNTAGSADTSGSGNSESADSNNTTEAEQNVSWLQEHMLGVITGVLAFIVLVIAWLLRRANAARDEGRDGNGGMITEAMVREKLEQINLDFEQQPPADPDRRKE